MDPVRNPYAPGAGQRPPELAGRDRELAQFAVVLERVATGRAERSLILTGLRGVGKTVLLNALRSQAIGRAWATGKLEARAAESMRRSVASAVHSAVREVAARHRDEDRVRETLGVLRSFAHATPTGAGRTAASGKGGRNIAIEVPAVRGRADSGDLEIDLTELLVDVGELVRDLGVGLALCIDELQDVPADELVALCGACHELAQRGSPVVVVGAGLPHLPALLSTAKTYSERLFRYVPIGALSPTDAALALTAPAAREGVALSADALAALYAESGGYPYFVQAYGAAAWDAAPTSPILPDDVALAAPVAEAELAVGFFGSRWERATPAEREYLRAMAALAAGGPPSQGPGGWAAPSDESDISTTAIASALGKRPASLSPARDSLIKKGLIFSQQRGTVAFTVPHFGRFLRQQG